MMKELQKLFKIITKDEKKRLVWLLALMLIASVLEIASIGAIPAYISIISNGENISIPSQIANVLPPLSNKELIIWSSICLVAIYLVKNIFSTLMLYLKANVTTNIQIRLSYDLLYKYYTAPYTFHLSRNSIDLFSKVYDEARIIVTSVLIPLLNIVMDMMFTLSIIIFLLIYDPFTSLIIFFCLGLTGYLFISFTKKKSTSLGRDLPTMRMLLNKSITEGMNGLKDSRILNREHIFLEQSGQLLNKTYHATKYVQFISTLTRPFIETIAIIAMVLICVIAVLQGQTIGTILPTLTLFAIAFIRLLPNINLLISGFVSIRNTLYTINPVYQDFKQLQEASVSIENDELCKALHLEKEIHIENLSYTYPGAEKKSLQLVDLTIRKGEAIGLIGSSGAGKTTLVDIILGLLEPQSGSIKIDGININDNIRSWQKNIGYIPQSIYLSDNTIRNNIAFGIKTEEIDDSKLWAAIEAAQLESLIKELPQGLETEIGERGVRLSGGQRQRIGIARALYHNPQILIMDEATSALDNVTEKYVVEAIDKLKGNRTIITIAHRLSTVKNCDCLYMMKHGKIITKGSYNELLQKSEEFREMAN
jgi:ABC-type multidrug transport system fused ATPase/permease subunit